MSGGRPRQPNRPGAVLAGLCGGFFSGLVGVGGGIVMVPMLTGLVGLRQHRAHGTSLAVIIFAAAAGGAVYWTRGDMAWSDAAVLLAGSMAGVTVGARLMHRIPGPQLRLIFAVFVFVVSLRMIVG